MRQSYQPNGEPNFSRPLMVAAGADGYGDAAPRPQIPGGKR